jgi:quercetin dioxygenase-like cupin family protein
MSEQILHHRGTTLVRRLTLEPGEAMPWHRDPYHRVTVILRGDTIQIEHHDGSVPERFTVTPGQVDWDEPYPKLHRGVNVGSTTYEEITTFFLDHPDAIPQPTEPVEV